MSKSTERYNTQWTAQFYAAAELTRRNYLVSFTHGNAPETDLIISSPNSINFRVDVKGQRTKNFWRFRKREPKEDLFYILVYIPKITKEHPTFFIATSDELMRERQKYKEHIMSTSGRYREEQGGMNWKRAFDYQDKWEILPK